MHKVFLVLGVRTACLPPDEAADLLNLKSIEFDVMRHTPFNTEMCFGLFGRRIDTTALIMTTREDRNRNEIIYASDNDDKKKYREFLRHRALQQLHLEVTFSKHGLHMHNTLRKLNSVVKKERLNEKMKKRIICNHHYTDKLITYCLDSGYSDAANWLYGSTAHPKKNG